MNKRLVIAWIVMLAGTILWLYGYFWSGHPALVDWHTYTPPRWIADFIPNMESEMGLALMLAAMIPMYWPSRRR